MEIRAKQIKNIILSLRNFSRMDESEYDAVDIYKGIDSTFLILEHRLRQQAYRGAIAIEKYYGLLPQMECYAGQLNQVFMNILVNAIDALEEMQFSLASPDGQQPSPPDGNPQTNLTWQPKITIQTDYFEQSVPAAPASLQDSAEPDPADSGSPLNSPGDGPFLSAAD